MSSMTFNQGSRPRKRSSVSYPALPQHDKRPSFAPGSPLEENFAKTSYHHHGSGSKSSDNESNALDLMGIALTVERLVKFLFVGFILFFCFGKLFSYTSTPYNTHRTIRGESANLAITHDPIIVPNLGDLPRIKNAIRTSTYKPVSHVYSSSASNGPPLVLVMSIDFEKYSFDDMTKIIQNREQYAKQHGYGLYVRYAQDYADKYAESATKEPSWSKLFVVRSAMFAFPSAKWFWYLDPNALIMNNKLDIGAELVLPVKNMNAKLQRGIPVVKATEYIKSFKFTKAEDIQLIMSQDHIGMNPISFLMKNGDWSHSLLEFWSDQPFRTYRGFDKSEASALNHLIQWHVSFLSKIGLVAPSVLASPLHGADAYKEGDLAVRFDCKWKTKDCHDAFLKYYQSLSVKTSRPEAGAAAGAA